MTAATAANATAVTGLETILTAGSNSVKCGLNSNALLTTGNSNVSVGSWTHGNLSSHTHSVAVGFAANTLQNGTSIGASSSAMGNNSTALGFQSTTGSGTNNTSIGNGAGVGYLTTQDDRIYLGNASVTGIYANTQSISALSDQRDKLDIQELPFDCTQYIDSLDPVMYRLNPRARYIEHIDHENGLHSCVMGTNDESKADTIYSLGVLAQQVETIESDLSFPNDMILDNIDNDHLAVKYTALIPILIGALRDSNNVIADLQTRLEIIEDLVE